MKIGTVGIAHSITLAPAAALRRLARTSCYFAKFAPNFSAWRDAIHRVRDLPEFRRLVKAHFR
jgi:hypothetical protein